MLKILAFAASRRSGSLNRKLIEVATGIARTEGADVDLAEFAEFDMPLYDGDLEKESGPPQGAEELKRRIEAVDAMLIASPEYNFSIPGTIKNAIDWVSRFRPMPWRGRSIYLMSAAPSPMGGIRGLWQLRIPLEGCGSLVFPDMFALPLANKAFADDGSLADEKLAARLAKDVRGFVQLAEAVAECCSEGSSAPERREKISEALEQQSEIQRA